MRNFTEKKVWRLAALVFFAWIGFVGLLSNIAALPAFAAEDCLYDYDSDGDADGLDLLEFIQPLDTDLADFADEFGRTICIGCRGYLPCDIVEANSCFQEAAANTEDLVSKTFHSVTRILALLYDPSVNQLLTDLGMEEEVRTFCGWTAGWVTDEYGEPILPETLPSSGSAIDVLVDALIPEVNGALEELSGIDNSIGDPFIILCEEFQMPGDESACESLEMDYGDVALYRAFLQFIKAFFLIIDSYDLDVEDVAEIINNLKTDLFSINAYLCDDDPATSSCVPPTFMRPKANAPVLLAEAKESLRGAIESYMEASEFIRNETDDQADDVISFPSDPEGLVEETSFRDVLSDIQCALDGVCLIDASKIDNPFDLDLTRLFDEPFDWRANMPLFTDENEIICGSFDPTLSGILPGFDNDFWANEIGLQIPVTGTVSCPDGVPCEEIQLYAYSCGGWFPDTPYEYRNCSFVGSASILSPGSYEISIRADIENIQVLAFWDKDEDGMLSPGDYYGAYLGDTFDTISENCAGPDNIDLTLIEEAVGIKGRITSLGAPVANATVIAREGVCGSWITNVRTNANGEYALIGLPETSICIEVSLGNNMPYIGGWWNGSSATENCNEAAVYTPSVGSTIVDISLDAADSVSGTVEDYSGTPIPYVQVTAYDVGGNWINSTSTDMSGAYIVYLNRPYSGTCILNADVYNSNHVSEYYDDELLWEDADPVVVDPVPGVHHVTGINFELIEGSRISGIVTDGSGSPIPWVSVSAYDYNTSSWIRGTNTQVDGRYTLQGLPAGTYRISAYAYGTDYVEEYYNNVYDYASATAVNLSWGQTRSGVDFSLEIGGRISGTVTKASDNQPVSNIPVYAYDLVTGSFKSSGTTDSNGVYTILGLSAGQYKVYVYPYATGYLNEFYDNVRDWDSAAAVNVVSDQTTPNINFSLETE